MKKLLLGFVSALLGFSLFFVFTKQVKAAVTPGWDVTGTYVVAFKLNPDTVTTYPHDAFLTQTGTSITGNGGFPVGGPYSYAWTITSGTISGKDINLTMDYTVGAVGTTMHMTGVINNDGSISGTWVDNYGGARTGTWATTSGFAKINSFDWGSEVNAGQCKDRIGKPVINITYKVLGDIDSGFHGYWAFDTYNRQIQVWKTTDQVEGQNVYCVVARYEGQFKAKEGALSPQNGTRLSNDVQGEMIGGRRAIIVGDLKTPSAWPTFGKLETVNYGCTDLLGHGCDFTTWSWPSKYFENFSYNDEWWGWVYRGGSSGTWVNSSDGSFGDIL